MWPQRGQKVQEWSRKVQRSPKQPRIPQNGPEGPRVDRSGPEGTRVALSGIEWPRGLQSCPDRTRKTLEWLIGVKCGPEWTRWDWICPERIIVDSKCAKVSQCDPT